MSLVWGVVQSATESEHEAKSEPLSRSERLQALLMFAFLGLVLLSRFSHSPMRWRKVDVSMSPEELLGALGTPTRDTANEIRWYEPHLLGDWELTAERHGTRITSLRKTYYWPGSSGTGSR